MSSSSQTPVQAIENAHKALRQGQRAKARHWAQIAVKLAPEWEEPWLLMAAVSSPEASLNYLKQALQINPQSQRARQGMHWAIQRLRKESEQAPEPREPLDASQTQPTLVRRRPASATRWGSAVIAALLLALFVIVSGLVAWKGYPQLRSALAGSTLAGQLTTQQTSLSLAFTGAGESATPEGSIAPIGEIPLSDDTSTEIPGLENASPTPLQPVEPTPTFTNTPLPTDTPTPTFTPLPTTTATQAEPTQMPVNPPVQPPSEVTRIERWIEVDLSEQHVYAYEGDQLQRSFLVSTGTWRTPTVQGKFRIYYKYRSQTMSGPGYYLPGVPFVMYFYKDYSLHGTYWHNNFGTPMSHGCVNMRTAEAKWLYNWASLGTLVYVHR